MKTKDESVIPKNRFYCYDHLEYQDDTQRYKVIGLCPYWSYHEADDQNGYCRFLGKSDRDLGAGLLFDQCKECDINTTPTLGNCEFCNQLIDDCKCTTLGGDPWRETDK